MRNALLFPTLLAVAAAQVPTGAIAGVVYDPSSAGVRSVQVKAVSLTKGALGTVLTSEQADYSFLALPSGNYEVSVEVVSESVPVHRIPPSSRATRFSRRRP
jgi:hypothetical protein